MRRLSQKLKQLGICCVVLLLCYWFFFSGKQHPPSQVQIEPDDGLPHPPAPQQSLGEPAERKNPPMVPPPKHVNVAEVNVNDFANGARKGYINFGISEKRTVPECASQNLVAPISAISETFQPVHPTSAPYDVYAYSAYYQVPLEGMSDGRRVRIVGIIRTSSASALFCQLWYRKDAKVMRVSRALITPVKADGSHSYSSAHIDCPVDTEAAGEAPYAVSLVTSQCESPRNTLVVTDNSRPFDNSKMDSNFAVVCPAPLNLQYNHVDQIVEWMEINLMLGANHFFFHNYSVGPNVSRVLEYYVSKGLATIIQWPVPVKVHVWPLPPNYREDIAYFAQAGQLSDCVMRAASRFRHAVLADLDETLLPRKHNSWKELFNSISPSGPPASVLFRNVFFKTEWPTPGKYTKSSIEMKLNLTTLLKNRRELEIYSPGSRSKVIVNPQEVDTMEVHDVLRFRRGSAQSHVLTPDEGLNHHYRNWEGMGTQQFVEDDNIQRFAKDIIDRVGKAKTALNIPYRY